MKKITFLLTGLIFAAGLFGSQLTMDEFGTVYEIVPVHSEEVHYLEFNQTRPNGETVSSIIPSTYDLGIEEDPYLIYIPRYKTLYLTWSFGHSDYRNICISSYSLTTKEWTTPFLISDRSFVRRYNSRSTFTSSIDGSGFLHIVWWEEYDENYGDTAYCVIPFGDDDLDYTNMATHHLHSYITSKEPTEFIFPESAYRYPNIWASGEGNRVTVLNPSPQDGYYYVMSFDFDNVDPDIIDQQRAHFPDIGVKFDITISAHIDTKNPVESFFSEMGRLVFYWENEESVSYTFYCNQLWSSPRTAHLKGFDSERVKQLFQGIIR